MRKLKKKILLEKKKLEKKKSRKLFQAQFHFDLEKFVEADPGSYNSWRPIPVHTTIFQKFYFFQKIFFAQKCSLFCDKSRAHFYQILTFLFLSPTTHLPRSIVTVCTLGCVPTGNPATGIRSLSTFPHPLRLSGLLLAPKKKPPHQNG